MTKHANILSLTSSDKKESIEAKTRPLDSRLIRRIFTYMRPYARQRNILLFLVLGRAMQMPALAWAIGAIIGGPIAGGKIVTTLAAVAGYAVFTTFTQIWLHFRSRLALELGEKVVSDVRREIFIHYQNMPMSFFNKARLGRIISRFSSDAEAIRVGIQDVIFVGMVSLGQMFISAGLMLIYDRILFLVVLGIAPAIIFINRIFHKHLSVVYRATQESFSRVTANIAESVKGVRVTQGFSREEINADMFKELITDHSKYNVSQARTRGLFLPLLEINSEVFVALIVLIGGYRVLYGNLNIQALYQFLLLSSSFFWPIQVIGNLYDKALSAMAGAERVFGVLDTKPEWTDPSDAIVLKNIKGKIEFVNVTFCYDPPKAVLNDISFTTEPGKILALVGHTGSGKTSIINLVSKFYLPSAGKILIDGIDTRNVQSKSLHSNMGIVLQQNFLFTGTVADNIRVGKPGASIEEVVAAAKKLDCLDVLAALPEGFNTRVGEEGSGISIGQRQLICFTRAMLANPKILILDEATSSIDTLTEAYIQRALAILLKERTSIVVAHRLSTIRNADNVLVLAHGRIVEQGTHFDLLKQGGHYAYLYRRFIS